MTSHSALFRKIDASIERNPTAKRIVRALGLARVLGVIRARARRAGGESEHEYIRLLLAFLLAPDSNCIDVGASYGVILEDITRLAPAGTHLAFEPIPVLHEQLTAKFTGVDVRRVALSDQSGEATFNWIPEAQGLSGLTRYKYAITEKGQELTVRTELLDEQLPPGYVPSFIKIDVEGGEYAVLRGAQKTLARDKPVLVIEYPRRGIPMPGMSRADLYDFLVCEIGYRVFDMYGHGPLTRSEFEVSTGLNFVFHL